MSTQLRGLRLFFKQPTKDDLRKQLQEQCDRALLLDNSIHTLYASQPIPTKGKKRPRKRPDSAYAAELEKLLSAEESSGREIQSEGISDENLHSAQAGSLEGSLEREVAEFMRNRHRK